MIITISDEIRSVCPVFIGAAVTATVRNTDFDETLWREIESLSVMLRKEYTIETIKNISAIDATRRMYKACGKDPSRYRPAAEALMRRIIQGKQLYRIDTLVDLVNMASIAYGYSIGGFDMDKIEGDMLTLGIGREGEPYEGIGRGMLNIAGLPVYRDATGGVGTPTSDNERTKMGMDTRRVLVLVNGYDGNRKRVEDTAELTCRLLREYVSGEDAGYFVYDV